MYNRNDYAWIDTPSLALYLTFWCQHQYFIDTIKGSASFNLTAAANISDFPKTGKRLDLSAKSLPGPNVVRMEQKTAPVVSSTAAGVQENDLYHFPNSGKGGPSKQVMLAFDGLLVLMRSFVER